MKKFLRGTSKPSFTPRVEPAYSAEMRPGFKAAPAFLSFLAPSHAGFPRRACGNTFAFTCLSGEPRHPQKQNQETAEELVFSHKSQVQRDLGCPFPPNSTQRQADKNLAPVTTRAYPVSSDPSSRERGLGLPGFLLGLLTPDVWVFYTSIKNSWVS